MIIQICEFEDIMNPNIFGSEDFADICNGNDLSTDYLGEFVGAGFYALGDNGTVGYRGMNSIF